MSLPAKLCELHKHIEDLSCAKEATREYDGVFLKCSLCGDHFKDICNLMERPLGDEILNRFEKAFNNNLTQGSDKILKMRRFSGEERK